MVDVATVARLVGGVLLLLSNGFFVTTEFAMTRVRQYPESEFQGPGLERAWEMTERLEIYLSGCQVGITISSIGLGVVGEPALAAVVDPALGALGVVTPSDAGHTAAAVVVSFAVINLLHVIVGEQAPTYLGIERTKFVAKYGAPVLYAWTKLMAPVILFSDRTAKALLGVFGVRIDRSWTDEEVADSTATRGEARARIRESLSSAEIAADRQEEVLGALDIGLVPVVNVMVDRSSIVALSTADDGETNLRRMEDEPHTRYPLIGEDFEEFRGIVYVPATVEHREALATGDIDFEAVAAPPMTLAADTSVSDAIDRFQAERQELALVVSEEGDEVVGMLTVTDAVEVVMGELRDPIDERVGT